jgi:hypothetical protein
MKLTSLIRFALFITLIIVLCTIPIKSCSQTLDEVKYSPSATWITVGLGLSEGTSGGKITALIEMSHKRETHQYSFRYSLGYNGYDATHSFKEISFMYGKCTKINSNHGAFSFGPSIIYDFGRYSDVDKAQIGLALGLQGFASGKYVGLGIYLSGNINKHDPYVSFSIALQIGRLKQKDLKSNNPIQNN